MCKYCEEEAFIYGKDDYGSFEKPKEVCDLQIQKFEEDGTYKLTVNAEGACWFKTITMCPFCERKLEDSN